MRAWIRVLDAPGCYERATLQSSGLVRTVGPCAQRRVALMPRAIATARDALSNDRRESPVATFEQSENVAIAHIVGAASLRGVASATASICACVRY